MLALDPPDAGGATIGGIVATNDSGPLRARYGGARDLVVGMRVALADGTVAKSGGKVIKNVAGYDLAKLFTGSFGTLGAILEVSVRLHPLPPATATAVGHTRSPHAAGRAAPPRSRTRGSSSSASTCAGRPAPGMVLARFGGVAARPQAESAERLLREAGLEAELVDRRRGALAGAARRASARRTGSWCACRRCRPTSRELAAIARAPRRHAGRPRRPGPVLAAPGRGRRRRRCSSELRARLRRRGARPPGRAWRRRARAARRRRRRCCCGA